MWSLFIGYLWSISRIFVPSPSGRNRYNILGALDAITHELISITNETYINAQTVCDLIKLIAYQNPGMQLITLVMDNAKYQHCDLVKQCANSIGIELLFLPSYSPNLNLIERYWKWLKADCLNCKYYSTFKDFKTAIDQALGKKDPIVKKKLESLLTLNFQTFDKAHIMTV